MKTTKVTGRIERAEDVEALRVAGFRQVDVDLWQADGDHTVVLRNWIRDGRLPGVRFAVHHVVQGVRVL